MRNHQTTLLRRICNSTLALNILFAFLLPLSVMAQSSGTCTGFRTQTQGGWGSKPSGGNNGTYLHANFASAFPAGVTLGCSTGNMLKLTSAQSVTDFLPSGSTASVLPKGTLINPTRDTYRNVFAGQLTAAVLNIGFDNYDANFSPNTINTGSLIYKSGTFAGWTVNAVIAEANKTIGGCASTYSPQSLSDALASFNENYDDGKSDKGNFKCATTVVCNISVSGVVTNVSCNGGNNGSIVLSTSGCIGTISYLWNDGVTTKDRSGLAAGTYSVTVTDSKNCSQNKSFTVTQPNAIGVTGAVINVSTVNGSDGSIDITVTGGTSPYTYLWNDGVKTEDRTGLAPGTYSVVVTDSKGCTKGATFTVNSVTCNLDFTGTVTNVSCNKGSNGSITITPSGNSGTMTYTWVDGPTTRNRTGLSAGNYCLTITDAKGCSKTKSFSVTEPGAISTNSIVTNVTNVNGADGSIDLTVSGGTPDYTFLWNDGATTEDRSGLSAGTYSVLITDKNGCTATASFTLTQPSCRMTVTGVVTDAVCYDGSNGAIDITATSINSGALTYQWSDGSTSEDRTGLAAGTYTVTVTDCRGCSATETFTVKSSTQIIINSVVINTSTLTGSDGSIDITVTGGTPGYTFLWNDGVTTEDRSGLAPGTYSVEVTDSKGCKSNASFTVDKPSCNMNITYTTVAAKCWDSNDGSIDMTVTGANGAVSYLWNDGVTTEDRSNLYANYYTVTVTDAAGCSQMITIHVHHPSQVKGSFTSTASQLKPCVGTVTLSATGGAGGYVYTWEDGFVGSYRTGLCPGYYNVTIADKKGCSSVLRVGVVRGTPPAAKTSSQTENKSSVSSLQAQVSPNPAKGIVRLTVNATKSANASIIMNEMISGKQVIKTNMSLIKGVNMKQLDLSSVPKGLYQLSVIDGDNTEVIKVAVQ